MHASFLYFTPELKNFYKMLQLFGDNTPLFWCVKFRVQMVLDTFCNCIKTWTRPKSKLICDSSSFTIRNYIRTRMQFQLESQSPGMAYCANWQIKGGHRKKIQAINWSSMIWKPTREAIKSLHNPVGVLTALDLELNQIWNLTEVF